MGSELGPPVLASSHMYHISISPFLLCEKICHTAMWWHPRRGVRSSAVILPMSASKCLKRSNSVQALGILVLQPACLNTKDPKFATLLVIRVHVFLITGQPTPPSSKDYGISLKEVCLTRRRDMVGTFCVVAMVSSSFAPLCRVFQGSVNLFCRSSAVLWGNHVRFNSDFDLLCTRFLVGNVFKLLCDFRSSHFTEATSFAHSPSQCHTSV